MLDVFNGMNKKTIYLLKENFTYKGVLGVLLGGIGVF